MRFEPLLKISNLTRDFSPLIHCITNYVTVNDCANVLLAIGASPVMADAKEEVEEFVSISSGLVLNLGTINSRVANSMLLAGKKAKSEFIKEPIFKGILDEDINKELTEEEIAEREIREQIKLESQYIASAINNKKSTK